MAVKRHLDDEGGAAAGPGAEDPVLEERCLSVSVAVASTASLPPACREMLAGAVEWSLGVPRRERDARQETVVGFIGETLERCEAELVGDAAAAEEETRDARAAAAAALQAASDRSAEAEAAVRAGHEALREKSATLDQETHALRVATEAFESAEAAHSRGEAELAAASIEHQLCLDGCRLLRGDGVAPGEDAAKDGDRMQEHIAVLQKVAAKLGLEESLVLTIPVMCRKALDERSFLDRAAAELLEGSLTKHVAALAGQIAEGPALVADLRGIAEAARAARDAAAERYAAVREAVKHAQAEQGTRTVELEALKVAERECLHMVQRVEVPWRVAKSQLAEFLEGPLKSYHMLRGDGEV